MENKLLEFQKKIGIVKKDSKNPHFKNTYASLEQILGEVKPILTELNLVLLQPIQDGKVYTNIYEDSKVIAYSCIELPTNLAPQALGSAITYFRRYTLSSLLALEIDDDDATMASKPITTKPLLTPQQFEAIINTITSGNKDKVIEALPKYTISKEHQTAIDLALKNN